MSFGSKLKKARKAKKLTQGEVSLKLGIDDTTISKYENDKSEPDNETLKKLSALYECSIDYLMGAKSLQLSTGEQVNEKLSDENEWKVRALKAEEELKILKSKLEKIKQLVQDIE